MQDSQVSLFDCLEEEQSKEMGEIQMNPKKGVSTVAWWRYPVAILAFVASYFLLPILFGLLLIITNWLSPEYYRNSELWIFVLSDILSVTTGFEIVDVLMLKQNYVFQAVWATVVAIYSFLVAVTNWFYGDSSLEQILGVLAMGGVAVVFVGISCKKNKDSNA